MRHLINLSTFDYWQGFNAGAWVFTETWTWYWWLATMIALIVLRSVAQNSGMRYPYR